MPRHSRTCHSAELLQCRSQIRDKLDANRQRQSKWTTDAELAVLTKLWGRMARRDDRGFDFTYSKLQKGRTAEIYFSAKAVKRKLAELKAVLPAEHYDFIAHTPADEMAVMLPMYQLLADATGCRQVSNGAASTHPRPFPPTPHACAAQVARSNDGDAHMWEATPSSGSGAQNSVTVAPGENIMSEFTPNQTVQIKRFASWLKTRNQ